MARAIARLLGEGQPFDRLCNCYFAAESNDLRWLGVFVHSAGDRVLFFPGFANTYQQVQGFKGQQEAWNQQFLFDHASLERDRQSWHATSPGSSQHVGSPKTLDLGNGTVLWLGLSVASTAVLRPALAQTSVVATVPPSDARRRAGVLRAARDGAQFPILQLNNELPPPGGASFLHFAVVVSSADAPDYAGPELGAPYGSPFLSEPLPDSFVNLPIRRHRVALSSTIHLQVTTARLSGCLSVPVTLTSPSGPTARAITS